MSLNPFLRYQVGMTINKLYPSINGYCACGCGMRLPKSKRKWYADFCRDLAFINSAIIKGDTSVIRTQLFLRDMGACKVCGCITDNWEADHIVPVHHGGGACDLSNFQTLCKDCHNEKSYNLSHHNNISSQAASIRVIRCLNEAGQLSNVCANKSIETQSSWAGNSL